MPILWNLSYNQTHNDGMSNIHRFKIVLKTSGTPLRISRIQQIFISTHHRIHNKSKTSKQTVKPI